MQSLVLTRRWLLAGCAALCLASAAAAQDTTGTGADSVTPAPRKLRVTGFPYVFSTPEAGVAFGVGGILTFYTSQTDTILRPSKVTVGGWYSLNDQYKISLVPLVYFNANRYQVSLPGDYGRFTDRFWGIGNQTAEFPEDTAAGAPNEKYRTSALNVKLDVQFPAAILHATRAGIVLEFNETRILDTQTNPLIDSTLVGSQGGQTVGGGFGLTWDTRNQTFFPSGGVFFQTKAVLYPLVFVADYQYTRFEVDLRKFVGRSPNEVFAFQAYGNFVFGEPPFYALSATGGATRLRGYFQGRYRDRHFVMAQAEYRRMVWWRLGFAAFAGAGDVFGSDSSELRVKNLKWSVGGGLRVLFNRAERVNLRADIGIGRHTTGVYFQLEEAF